MAKKNLKKDKMLHGLLTKEEICQICDISPKEFDYHMGMLMTAGLVAGYVKK